MVGSRDTSFEGMRTRLAGPNLDTLPSKEPCINRPCTGSKHYQTYSESRQQEMNAGFSCRRIDEPYLNNGLQRCCEGCP